MPPATPYTPHGAAASKSGLGRAASLLSDMKRLRSALAGRIAEEVSGSTMRLADNAMQWGNAAYCETLLAGKLAGIHLPDGGLLIASLLYPVRSSAITTEAARAAANLAFYATDGDTQDVLLSSGIIPELVKAIQWSAAEADEDVAQSCCMALCDMCLESSPRRTEAINCGAARAVAAVLNSFRDVPEARVEAQRTLAMLACEAEGRRAIAKAGSLHLLLQASQGLSGGQVMMKRSQTIVNVREIEAENRLRSRNSQQLLGASSKAWCPRSSPANSPIGRRGQRRHKGVAMAAEEELRRLRWHRGDWDGRKAISDCTQLMPCKGALRNTVIRIGERFLIANGDSGLRHLVTEGFSDARSSAAGQGDSIFLCAAFAWLEGLLSWPLTDTTAPSEAEDRSASQGDSAAGGVALGDPPAQNGVSIGPRRRQADIYKAKIDGLSRDVAQLDLPLKELVSCGYENLRAVIYGLCDEDDVFSRNELVDVLSGSLRFTCAIIAFLRAAASAAMQNRPDVTSRLLHHSSTLAPRDLRGLCERHVEPLGADPSPVLDALANGLAESLGARISIYGFPLPRDVTSFPQDPAVKAAAFGPAATCDIYLGLSTGPKRAFLVLYPEQAVTERCPHLSRLRTWAASRAAAVTSNRPAFKASQFMPGYPPRPGLDEQRDAMWHQTMSENTQRTWSPDLTRTADRRKARPATATVAGPRATNTVRRHLDF